MEKEQLNDILDIDNSNNQNSDHQNNSDNSSTQNRYPALKTISSIFLVLAWIVAIASFMSLFYFLSESDGIQYLAIVSIFGGGLFTIGLLSISEIIKVFMDIEENTRKTSEKKN
jgi:hypothetical protein